MRRQLEVILTTLSCSVILLTFNRDVPEGSANQKRQPNNIVIFTDDHGSESARRASRNSHPSP